VPVHNELHGIEPSLELPNREDEFRAGEPVVEVLVVENALVVGCTVELGELLEGGVVRDPLIGDVPDSVDLLTV